LATFTSGKEKRRALRAFGSDASLLMGRQRNDLVSRVLDEVTAVASFKSWVAPWVKEAHAGAIARESIPASPLLFTGTHTGSDHVWIFDKN
jgi:hypothetical protein